MAEADIREYLGSLFREAREAMNMKIQERIYELRDEAPDYYRLMNKLGFPQEESTLIDRYHNIGRIVFRHLGTILQDLTRELLTRTVGGEKNVRLPNSQGGSPRTFIIDWLHGRRAYQIKWRYATTDGTTVNKEIAFARQLQASNYTPVFLVYYRSLRPQPLACFERIAQAFISCGGEVYSESTAWEHITSLTGFDLQQFLEEVT